jgi:hypothetical protein
MAAAAEATATFTTPDDEDEADDDDDEVDVNELERPMFGKGNCCWFDDMDDDNWGDRLDPPPPLLLLSLILETDRFV